MFLILAVVLALLWLGGFFLFHVSSLLIHIPFNLCGDLCW